MFTLPPDSPELNPDELVWNVIMRKVRTIIESKDAMRSLVRRALRKLQRSTETVKRRLHEKRLSCITADRRV